MEATRATDRLDTNPPGFQYDALSENLFRLFLLDVDEENEELSGSLMTTYQKWNAGDRSLLRKGKMAGRGTPRVMKELTGSADYDTFSYCWGSQQETFPLRLSVISDRGLPLLIGKVAQLDFEPHRNGMIQIGYSLKSLLEEMRRRKHKRFVWIDAICIDQDSDSEKRMQIPMMKDIFTYAANGYVWLGEGSTEEVELLELLPYLIECLEQSEAGSEHRTSELPGDNASSVEGSDTLLLEEGQATAKDTLNDGNGEEDAQAGRVGNVTFEEKEQANDSLEEGGGDDDDEDQDDPDSGGGASWAALRSILMKPWWTRLWTLQEVVVHRKAPGGLMSGDVATVVWLSDASVELQLFFRLSDLTARSSIRPVILSEDPKMGLDCLYGWHAIDEIRICRNSMLFEGWGVKPSALLLGTRRRQSTLDADAVYGMLAMMDDHMAALLAPNANSTTQEVFIKFAKYYIRNEHREHLFSHISTETRLEGLPSWCPNFASLPSVASLGSQSHGRIDLSPGDREQFFHAGYGLDGKWRLRKARGAVFKGIANFLRGRNIYNGLDDWDNPRRITIVPDLDHLLVSGMHIDIVAEVVECNPAIAHTGWLSPESLCTTQKWESECLRLAMKYMPEGDDRFDIYIRTLFTNRNSIEFNNVVSDIYDYKHEVDFLEVYRDMKEYIGLYSSGEEDVPEEDERGKRVWYWMLILFLVQRGRKFFATKNGRIGLGPNNLQVGDSVRVLFFCPTPYLFREALSGRCQLIGEAYVHGLMYGEALDMLEKHQLTEEKWIIE